MVKTIVLAAALGMAAAIGADDARAQMANLPPEVQQTIAHLGPVLNPDMIAATFNALRPIVKQAPMDGLKMTTDVSYGPDARHLLDVVVSKAGALARPVVIFIHGGGYVGGSKNRDGIYANVAAFFARHGALAINATYRLAPQHPWPAGAEDVGRVVAWAQAHAAENGGDPARIVLIGHSAGATHVASYVFDPKLHPASGPGLAGAVLISGAYRMTKAGLASPNAVAYFGKDESQFAERSPITHVPGSKTPVFLAVSEWDPPYLFMPTMDLAEALCQRDGKCPRLIWLKGHNHISETASFDTPDHELGDAILDWMAGLK